MYDLTFVGFGLHRNGLPVGYRRKHETFESAEALALAILAKIDHRAAHPAIIFGPGCGRDGKTIN
jgi:hypothetical protein